MAPASLHFLDLPPEIRHAVYNAYVNVDGGYVVNPRTNKLIAATGSSQKHDYALQLTCKQIAREMSGLALCRNTLHFKVEYSNKERISAARFDATVVTSLVRLVEFLTPDEDGGVDFTQDIEDEVIREFPLMKQVFGAISINPDTFGDLDLSISEDFGIPISVFLKAGWRAFGLAVKHGLIPKTYSMLSYSDAERAYAASQEFWPWYYNPSRKDFARMLGKAKARMFRRQGYRYWLKPHLDREGKRQWTQGKYRFSAASKAIRFLSQCPKQVKTQLRRIHLHETAHSVAFSECHALGLIPFCQENPHLYIERRVNIWRTLFQTDIAGLVIQGAPEVDWRYHTNPDYNDAQESANGARLASYCISRMFSRWAMEALELARSGMPRRSFKLVLDGDPAPQLATRLFRDIIQRDATWQRVTEASWKTVQDQHPTVDLTFLESHAGAYFFDGFPDMVDAVAGSKHELIECAFETGPSPWEVTAMYRQFCYVPPGLPRFEAVLNAFAEQPHQFFDLPHPLPSWKDLLAENILPEFFDTDADAEVEQVSDVDLYDILGDMAPGTDEDDIATSDDEDGIATSDYEVASGHEPPPSDDSEAAEDARSYDGGENDD